MFKQVKSWLVLVCLALLPGCAGNGGCYEIQLGESSGIEKDAPVFMDGGIVAFVEEVRSAGNNEGYMAKFCLPDAVQIPRNSKVYVGLIPVFSVKGVKIVPSEEGVFVGRDEISEALPMGSIAINLPPEDTVLTNTLIDIMKDISEKNKVKSQMIHEDSSKVR